MAAAEPTVTFTSLRAPGKNESRCIMRHAVGYYGALVVAGIYSSQNWTLPIAPESFFPVLKHCITTHPILSATINGAGTENPQFVRPSHLDLRLHVKISGEFDGNSDEHECIKVALTKQLDCFYQNCDRVPPWHVTVFPLSTSPNCRKGICLISFAYSHSHGDGISGLAFHKTFVQGLRDLKQVNTDINLSPFYQPPPTPLLPTIESATNLSVTWSYLIGPLVGTYLPKFVANVFNVPKSISPNHPFMWRGKPISYNPLLFHTGLDILALQPTTLESLLVLCRQNSARLTGLLHQLIVRALSVAVPKHAEDPKITPSNSFVATTTINLRGLASSLAKSDMLVGASAAYELFLAYEGKAPEPISSASNDDMWTAARLTTHALAAAAGTNIDQPIGLLRYLQTFRSWFTGQLGGERDASYELSNIMSFDSGNDMVSGSKPHDVNGGWEIGHMYFSQPANVTGPPLNFNVVSCKDGCLVICLSWQRDVLGVKNEDSFAKEVLEQINLQVKNLLKDKSNGL